MQREIRDGPAESVVGQQREALAACGQPVGLLRNELIELLVIDSLTPIIESDPAACGRGGECQ
jgi:hypothetical protein